MYKITINDETIIAEDYSVPNMDKEKILYVRLENKEEIGYKVNGKSYTIEYKE